MSDESTKCVKIQSAVKNKRDEFVCGAIKNWSCACVVGIERQFVATENEIQQTDIIAEYFCRTLCVPMKGKKSVCFLMK